MRRPASLQNPHPYPPQLPEHSAPPLHWLSALPERAGAAAFPNPDIPSSARRHPRPAAGPDCGARRHALRRVHIYDRAHALEVYAAHNAELSGVAGRRRRVRAATRPLGALGAGRGGWRARALAARRGGAARGRADAGIRAAGGRAGAGGRAARGVVCRNEVVEDALVELLRAGQRLGRMFGPALTQTLPRPRSNEVLSRPPAGRTPADTQFVLDSAYAYQNA